MTSRQWERLLWLMTATYVFCVGAAVVNARPRSHAASPGIPTVPSEPRMYDPDTLSAMAESVATHDLFRLGRRPTGVAFGMPATPTLPPQARPQLQLTLGGVMGGPPWRAVVLGVPGHDGGVVVGVGDTVGGIRIRAIRRDTVVVRGADTTWTLTLK